MASAKLQRKKETLEGEKRYHRLLLTPSFKRYLVQRKKMLEEKIYHLRYIAQDCKDWKVSDLEAIKRGMEISILKYRLAKELTQAAREVLDDMLSDVYPFLVDPRGLEEKVWEVFDNEAVSDSDETERQEAEQRLEMVGFRLHHMPAGSENPPAEIENVTDSEIDDMLRRETASVNQQTEELLAALEEKKLQLGQLEDLNDAEAGSSENE